MNLPWYLLVPAILLVWSPLIVLVVYYGFKEGWDQFNPFNPSDMGPW